mmetsp:Transcript_25344/g.100066  ORF Transcript_25344/g.100066 Transcript_25344/m.100066 type:complete len:227 (+) Transcript_25344:161-841(+)
MGLYRLRGLVLGTVFLFVWTVDWLLRCLDGLKEWLDQLIFEYRRSILNGCMVQSLHVAIICEDLELSSGSIDLGVDTLARVCCWCSEEGAKLITLYDGSGGLAELSGAISDSVKRQTESEHVKVEVGAWKAKLPQEKSNMITTSVRIITPEFGRGALVNYTRALSGNGSLSKGKISFEGTFDVPALVCPCAPRLMTLLNAALLSPIRPRFVRRCENVGGRSAPNFT